MFVRLVVCGSIGDVCVFVKQWGNHRDLAHERLDVGLADQFAVSQREVDRFDQRSVSVAQDGVQLVVRLVLSG